MKSNEQKDFSLISFVLSVLYVLGYFVIISFAILAAFAAIFYTLEYILIYLKNLAKPLLQFYFYIFIRVFLPVFLVVTGLYFSYASVTRSNDLAWGDSAPENFQRIGTFIIGISATIAGFFLAYVSLFK